MRSRRHATCLAVLLTVVVAGSAACGDGGGSPTAPTAPETPMQSDEDAARQSVDAWLSLLDAGDFSAAYDATPSLTT